MTTNNKDLSIYPVHIEIQEDPKFDDLDARLPKPPFLAVLQAPCASGKSVAIVNMLYNQNFYRDLFDSVVLVSPSIENDLTWAVALEDDKNLIVSGEKLEEADEIIDNIYKQCIQQVKDAEKQKISPPHTLIVLDDCLGLLGKKFARLCTRYRHPRISIMVASQNFRSLPLQCRQNASDYLIWRSANAKEIAKLDDEFSGNFPTFKALYNQATAERFHFLHLDNRKMIAWQDFDHIIYEKHPAGKQEPMVKEDAMDDDL